MPKLYTWIFAVSWDVSSTCIHLSKLKTLQTSTVSSVSDWVKVDFGDSVYSPSQRDQHHPI